jgi:hypothetical protein
LAYHCQDALVREKEEILETEGKCPVEIPLDTKDYSLPGVKHLGKNLLGIARHRFPAKRFADYKLCPMPEGDGQIHPDV